MHQSTLEWEIEAIIDRLKIYRIAIRNPDLSTYEHLKMVIKLQSALGNLTKLVSEKTEVTKNA